MTGARDRDIRLLICTGSRSIQGGVEEIIADLCRNLPRHGILPLLGLCKGARFNHPGRYREAFPDLRTVEIDGTRGTRQARVEAMLKTISRVRPDIVLAARVADACEAVSRLKARRGGWPRLAVTIQAFEPHYIYDAFLYRQRIDLAVAAGRLIQGALVKWCGLSEDRVLSIPGGARPPVAPVGPRQLHAPLTIGYVGRLEQQQKRILDMGPFLAGLCKAGVSFTCHVVGAGPAEESLKDLLRPLTATGQVTFHGWQTQDALYEVFYPRFDVLVHFARVEGVPIAPREAMAHGVVPVIPEFPGLRADGHFLNGINALTFPVGDVSGAVDRACCLAREPGLLPRLSAAALESQTGVYSYEGAIEAWALAFHDCMNREPMAGAAPRLPFPPDGRLARWGVSPWLAQRLRDLGGKRQIHGDGGSEWPTGTGLMTPDMEREIMGLVDSLDMQARHEGGAPS